MSELYVSPDGAKSGSFGERSLVGPSISGVMSLWKPEAGYM